MAIHKKEEFTQKEQDLAEFAKALAHPARIAILKILAQHNECICGEIVEVLPLAQSTVSQHLKELKTGCLVAKDYFLQSLPAPVQFGYKVYPSAVWQAGCSNILTIVKKKEVYWAA